MNAGRLLEDAVDRVLQTAVCAVAAGGRCLSLAVSEAVLNKVRRRLTDALGLVTSREREIVHLAAENKSSTSWCASRCAPGWWIEARPGRL